jgi:hypothetical protein
MKQHFIPPENGIPILKGSAIITLDDMLQFYAGKFYLLGENLQAMKDIFEGYKTDADIVPEYELPTLDLAKRYCSEIGLSMSLMKAESIQKEMKAGLLTRYSLAAKIQELSSRVFDELKTETFLHLNHEEVSFLIEPLPEWVEVLAHTDLLIVYRDAYEASKCLGMSRYPASVFHLMRVMEASFTIMKRWEGTNFPEVADRNWGAIIGSIEGYFADKHKATHPGPGKWKKAEPFYSDLLATLAAVKDAWRNQISHFNDLSVDQFYDFEVAKNIYRAVVAFMQKMARKP